MAGIWQQNKTSEDGAEPLAQAMLGVIACGVDGFKCTTRPHPPLQHQSDLYLHTKSFMVETVFSACFLFSIYRIGLFCMTSAAHAEKYKRQNHHHNQFFFFFVFICAHFFSPLIAFVSQRTSVNQVCSKQWQPILFSLALCFCLGVSCVRLAAVQLSSYNGQVCGPINLQKSHLVVVYFFFTSKMKIRKRKKS